MASENLDLESNHVVDEDVSGAYDADDVDDADVRNIFVSRVPAVFDEEILKTLFEAHFGEGSVMNVSLALEKEEVDEDAREQNFETEQKGRKKDNDKDKPPHRGFAFVTMDTIERAQDAIDQKTLRASVKATSKRKYTLYIRPIVRDEKDSGNDDGNSNTNNSSGICFLWSESRCPYGEDCKFSHEGEGGCLEKSSSGAKKQKCFAFKKKGKCKAGDACPFSHDLKEEPPKKSAPTTVSKGEKDCINWKNKGKCRKGEKCPFRHDPELQKAVLAKKSKASSESNDDATAGKTRQPISIRIFGLNYDTTEADIRAYLEHCGPIVEITFPTFDDSGRSKGYCGVFFQSPKAVAKAVELDGQELQGRWLRIQSGKMYLRKWGEQQEQQQGRDKRQHTENDDPPRVGEFGQKVKKRKTHGY
jgi:RNA recognition motif-containing protein